MSFSPVRTAASNMIQRGQQRIYEIKRTKNIIENLHNKNKNIAIHHLFEI
jgi:hypothetical protein